MDVSPLTDFLLFTIVAPHSVCVMN